MMSSSTHSSDIDIPQACEVCVRCLIQIQSAPHIPRTKVKWTQHHATFEQLEGSGNNCLLCGLFLLHIRKRWPRDGRLPCNFRMAPFGQDITYGQTQKPEKALFGWDHGHIEFLYMKETEFEVLAKTSVKENERSMWLEDGPISLDRRWPWVQSVLQECKATHAECQAHQQTDFMPTRLIQLPESTGGKTQLVDTHSFTARVPYTTLSHRWGLDNDLTSAPIQTTQLLERERPYIPISSLPKTFADAVEVTRRLGMKHIWIDSICIVQDSTDDWEHEASRMALVYQGSELNIAAADSPNSYGGCYLESLRPTIKLHIPAASIGYTRIWTKSDSKALLRSILLSRGWYYTD
jgi:hypothetical protein